MGVSAFAGLLESVEFAFELHHLGVVSEFVEPRDDGGTARKDLVAVTSPRSLGSARS